MTVLKIEKATNSIDKKLGEILWENFDQNEITEDSITGPVNDLVDHICKTNSIDKSKIKVHVVDKDEVNAFALPDNYLVVYSGLIEACENEAELMGVLGHEIAHIEKKHVMKRLVKEVGLSVLISMTSGGGGDAIKEIAKMLSSSAYDRDLEREADMTSVDYLLKAHIDPEPFANFLYRLSEEQEGLPDQVYWISTHPESKERAADIIEYAKNRVIEKKTILSAQKWKQLKDKLDY